MVVRRACSWSSWRQTWASTCPRWTSRRWPRTWSRSTSTSPWQTSGNNNNTRAQADEQTGVAWVEAAWRHGFHLPFPCYLWCGSSCAGCSRSTLSKFPIRTRLSLTGKRDRERGQAGGSRCHSRGTNPCSMMRLTGQCLSVANHQPCGRHSGGGPRHRTRQAAREDRERQG